MNALNDNSESPSEFFLDACDNVWRFLMEHNGVAMDCLCESDEFLVLQVKVPELFVYVVSVSGCEVEYIMV